MQHLYTNAIVITMEESQPMADTILVEDGRIIRVGQEEKVKKGLDMTRICVSDMEGKIILPAFIDAHSHLSSYAASLLQVPLDDCRNSEEIARQISEFIRENHIPEGQWITAKGYDHNRLAKHMHPELSLLDACCPKNPLVLQHASGHVGVFNSSALKALGVTPETQAPAGGVIGSANGRLTGYMEENAFFAYLKKVPMADMRSLMAAYKKAQELYASYGMTTIQEGMMVAQMVPLYQYLMHEQLLTLDVVGYADIEDADAIYTAFSDCEGAYRNGFRLGGYKIFLDGSPQGRTAWMRTPYLPESGGTIEDADCSMAKTSTDEPYTGYGTMSDTAVRAAMEKAAETGRQLLAHCNGDAAAKQYIDAAKDTPGIAAVRPVMIHAQLLGRDQLLEMKAAGIMPSFFVAHVWHWGDTHIKNFGYPRASQISPAESALKAGIRFTFHQDAPVIVPDMLETIGCAVNRRTKAGIFLGEDEAITVYEALKAVTIHAAYQYGEENEKGSIAPGKRADFVVLEENPLEVSSEKIKDIRILGTIKADQIIYQYVPHRGPDKV